MCPGVVAVDLGLLFVFGRIKGFFIGAGAMLAVVVVFALIARRYKVSRDVVYGVGWGQRAGWQDMEAVRSL